MKNCEVKNCEVKNCEVKNCEVKNCGTSFELLAELARRMKQARSGIVFFGIGLARGEAGHCNVQALLNWWPS